GVRNVRVPSRPLFFDLRWRLPTADCTPLPREVSTRPQQPRGAEATEAMYPAPAIRGVSPRTNTALPRLPHPFSMAAGGAGVYLPGVFHERIRLILGRWPCPASPPRSPPSSLLVPHCTVSSHQIPHSAPNRPSPAPTVTATRCR